MGCVTERDICEQVSARIAELGFVVSYVTILDRSLEKVVFEICFRCPCDSENLYRLKLSLELNLADCAVEWFLKHIREDVANGELGEQYLAMLPAVRER